MTNSSFLEKNMEFLIEESDDLLSEQNKLQYHYRAVQRQQQQQQKWIQQRVWKDFLLLVSIFYFVVHVSLVFNSQRFNELQKQDNIQRRRNGEAELPEKGDDSDPLWKPIPAPSQLDTMVIQSQIEYYCDQTNQTAGASINKHYMLNSLHKK